MYIEEAQKTYNKTKVFPNKKYDKIMFFLINEKVDVSNLSEVNQIVQKITDEV